MKKILTILILLLLTGSAFACPTHELIALLNKTTRLSADFTQNIYDESGHLIDHSSGQLKLAKPGLFYWQVLKPMKQLVVSNNKQVWIYDPELQQVIIKSANQTLSAAPLAILSGDAESLADNFQITKTKQGYQLNSEAEDLNFKTIRLNFTESQINSMVLFDNLGQKTELVFTHLVSNPSFPKETFEFVPPKGVDVVDSR